MSKLLQGLRNLLLAALLLVSVLCVTEVGLRAARWYRTVHQNEPAGPMDEAEIVVAGTETFFQLRPMSHLEREDPETAGVVAFRTNSFGLRGPEIESPKTAGVFRILCLGDETTLAPEVGEEQTYCHQLQQLLQPLTDLRVEVVNAGLPGGCPLTCELLLRRRLLGVQPDLILLHFDDSDVTDDRLVRRFTRLAANGVPLAAVHPLAATGGASPATRLYEEFLVLDLARNHLVNAFDSRSYSNSMLTRTTLSRPALTAPDDEVNDVDIDQALARLPSIRELAAGIYCDFIVSRCPSAPESGGVGSAERGLGARMQPVSMVEDSQSPVSRRLAELTREHGIPLMDASAEFGPGEHQLYLTDQSNLSAEGHARYARSLARLVYERVPGVWTRPPAPPESPTVPTGVPPLPGVARTPRD